MRVVPLFIFGDFKCIEYNNYFQCPPIKLIIFVALGHRRKFIQVKNKHVKYSLDLIWATYGTKYSCGINTPRPGYPCGNTSYNYTSLHFLVKVVVGYYSLHCLVSL